MNPTKKIAILVPVFNESTNLVSFVHKVEAILEKMPIYQWKIVFVDDGSHDQSWEIIQQMAEKNLTIQGIMLSRNFGKEAALSAGAENCLQEDAVICIDADLQHPPELIPEMVRQWEQGIEMVAAVRKDVADYTWTKKIGSKLFYTIMNSFSDLNLQPGITDFRLLDKKIILSLQRFSERSRLFRGLVEWMGFKKKYIYFHAPARKSGELGYSFKKLYTLAINSFTSFSLLPLRITGYLGILITGCSALTLFYMLVSSTFADQIFRPIAYFVVMNSFLIGVILSALGMIALYIGHIHTEVVNRPLYLISQTTDQTILPEHPLK